METPDTTRRNFLCERLRMQQRITNALPFATLPKLLKAISCAFGLSVTPAQSTPAGDVSVDRDSSSIAPWLLSYGANPSLNNAVHISLPSEADSFVIEPRALFDTVRNPESRISPPVGNCSTLRH
eukprot:2911131-Prymnesium_polylepis.2